MRETIEKHLASKQPVRSDEIVGLLEKCGFDYRQGKGSHIVYWHPDFNIRGVLPVPNCKITIQKAVLNDCLEALDKAGAALVKPKKKTAKKAFAQTHLVDIKSSEDLPDIHETPYNKELYSIETDELNRKWIISKRFRYLRQDITQVSDTYEITALMQELFEAENYIQTVIANNREGVHQGILKLENTTDYLSIRQTDLDFEIKTVDPLDYDPPLPPSGVIAQLDFDAAQYLSAVEMMDDLSSLNVLFGYHALKIKSKQDEKNNEQTYSIEMLDKTFTKIVREDYSARFGERTIIAANVYIDLAWRFLQKDRNTHFLGFDKYYDQDKQKITLKPILEDLETVEIDVPFESLKAVENHIQEYDRQGISYFTDYATREDFSQHMIELGSFIDNFSNQTLTISDHCARLFTVSVKKYTDPLLSYGNFTGMIQPIGVKQTKGTVDFIDKSGEKTKISVHYFLARGTQEILAVPDELGCKRCEALLDELKPKTVLPGLPGSPIITVSPRTPS